MLAFYTGICYSVERLCKMKNNLKGSLCLMTTVLIWGSAFIAQSVGMNRIGPFTF